MILKGWGCLDPVYAWAIIHEEGLLFLDKAIDLNPNFAEALISRGLVRFKQKDKIEALTDLEKAHRLKPHVKQIWDLIVHIKLERKEYSELISILNLMIQIDPDNEKSFLNLAICYQNIEELEASAQAYKKAITIKPDYPEALNNFGIVLRKQNKLDEALKLYEKAIAIKPDYSEALNNLGLTFKEKQKYNEAIEAYEKALKIKPDFVEVYNNLGLTLRDQGKLEEAIEAYEKALKIKPNFVEVYNNLGKSSCSGPR